MPGSIVIGLIIVIWLFVLAPLVVRGHKPISHAGDGFADTRVLFRGDTDNESRLGAVKRPRRPIAKAPRSTGDTDDDEWADIDDMDDDFLFEEELAPKASLKDKIKGFFGATDTEEQNDPGVIAADTERETAAVTNDDEPEVEPVRAFYYNDDTVVIDAVVTDDEAIAGPADVEHPLADYSTGEESTADTEDEPVQAIGRNLDVEGATDTVTDEIEADTDHVDDPGLPIVARRRAEIPSEELTEEDKAFAARRRGRGGFDPEADAARQSSRYQRRQRTLIVLGALVLVGVILSIVFKGFFWIIPSIALVLAAVYLVALRNQVQQERLLRARRIEHVRRARLGVKTKVDEELGIPARLRRPGAVVLEIDDESPDFVDLDEVSTTATAGDDTLVNIEDYQQPRRMA